MTEKELRRLNRRELLEILINQTKEIASLRETIGRLETELDDKRVTIAEAGSMAEAALKLNGIFEAADKAAMQYIENAKRVEEENRRILEETRKKTKEMISEAEKICDGKVLEKNLPNKKGQGSRSGQAAGASRKRKSHR